jgi:hypothetical protein
LVVSGEVKIAGSISGAEHDYKASLRDAWHQDTSAALHFHFGAESPAVVAEVVVGPGVVFSRMKRTPVCFVQCPPTESSDSERWVAIRPLASGGINLFARVGRVAFGPMLRLGYHFGGKYDAAKSTRSDMSDGPLTYAGILAARVGF